MRKNSIIDLINEENLEDALTLREKYIENAALPKRAFAFRAAKRACAVCLALLFLMIPSSVFLMNQDGMFPPHAYFPLPKPETISSFKELNDILGAEHLYNKLSEEYNTSLTVYYTIPLNCQNMTELYPSLNWSANTANNSLFDIIPQKITERAEIEQAYPNGDILTLNLWLAEKIGYCYDVQTEIGGTTVYLFFEGASQTAIFFYGGQSYQLTLVSEKTDITHYLKILLEGKES